MVPFAISGFFMKPLQLRGSLLFCIDSLWTPTTMFHL